ncbi:MAG: pentapeptide repeat-containing protein, partial [Phycisphaerae bacterium]|nr:pentapeptide repeat-containing protein [Phycisphaerae bacterium]
LSGANLTNANLDRVQLSDADLSRADTRGAFLGEERIADAGNVHNLIFPDGNVKGLEIIAGQTMRIGDYEGDIAITIEDIMTVDPLGGLKMIFEDDMWDSTISFETSIDVTLAGTLELLIADDIDRTELVGVTFHLFDWTGVNPVGAFDSILTQPGTHWDTSALYTTGHITLIYAGSIIFVEADATGANNGSSWTDAFSYLQDALSVALWGNEIWVAEGTYKPDRGSGQTLGDRNSTFQLINGVAIKGGYGGLGEPNPNARDIQLHKTILSGDIGTPDVDTDNSYHVVTDSGTDPNAILDGFTITAGNANGSSWPDNYGGGMYNSSGSPTVSNCIFSRNSSSHIGGGMHNGLYSSPTVTNCRFINNSADYGGGMYNDLSSTTVVNCIFSGNTADADFGGGMCNGNGNPSVINCTFSSNSSRVGGGMHCTNCSLTLTNCILWGNTAKVGQQIYDFGTISATVSYCDVQGGWTGVGNINADPLFKDADGLDDIAGTEDDNLKLSNGSPCIDAGYNPAIPLFISLDLAGNPRFFDDFETIDTGYGGPSNVDMGAHEYFVQLAAYWKLDEIGGNIAYDSSGNGNHGSLYGDPNWQLAGGKKAGALEFDGIDDYVLENGGLNLNGLDGLTIALWIRSDVTGTDRGFIHFEDPHGTDDRGMRYDAFGGTGGGVSLIKIGVTSDSPDGPPGWPGRQQLESSSNVQTTDWQHLAMTWSSGEQLKLYINGVLDTPTANEPALSGVLFGYNMVLIGRGGKYGQPETDAMGWDGLIDDVRIYNYALNGDDIRWLLCDKPPIGDVNSDCRFDFVDFAILVSEWLDCGMMNPELCGQ